MKVQALSNITDFSKAINIEEVSSTSFEEHVLKIARTKYNLGVAYFVLLSTLVIGLFI